MIIGTWLAIAFWYGRRPGARLDAEAVIVTTWLSVLAVARPMPGKCFIAGTSPPDSSPVANASDNVAVAEAPNDQVRPCWYMKEAVDTGTSATGARLLLIPAQRSTNPVAFPWAWAVEALPRLAICAGERLGGAQATRFTEPPSWSVAINSGS